ncbi:MAG TPA: MotA/TolQ/ExbB proton channel family protein [Candidatus Binatia bacterium]
MSELISLVIKGGPVMAPLLLCSVVSLAVTIERILFWRKGGGAEEADRMLAMVDAGDADKAMAIGRASAAPVPRVLAAGLAHRNPSPAKAMEAEAQTEMPRLKQRLTVLDSVVTLAPLLGLLGTITGMIGSFGIMSEAGIGQPHAVTGGVAEALIATATGLLIAILTLIPYNYFSHRAERQMDEIEKYATRLELMLAEKK